MFSKILSNSAKCPFEVQNSYSFYSATNAIRIWTGTGTASVFWVEGEQTAYITDGGRGTNLLNPESPLLEDASVLAFLRKQGVQHLVITCSHPHADHRDGLVQMIQHDREIFEFSRIFFVESDYPVGQSLHQIYRNTLKELKGKGQSPQNPPQTRSVSATNSDAFALIARQLQIPMNSRLQVNNFVYEPAMNAGDHGRSIITHYTLRKDANVCRIVDFDDANNDLVRQWAKWATASRWRPDVVILPHHGSRNSDISPLLVPALRPRSFVVTVNGHNQYFHPGAETVLRCVLAVGRENVHFTGVSQNVEINENGIAPNVVSARHRRHYELFIHPQLVRAENRLAVVEEQLLSDPKNAELLTERRRLHRRTEVLVRLRTILTRRSDERPPPLATASPPPGGPPRVPPGSGRPDIGGRPSGPNDGDYADRARQIRREMKPGPGPIVPRIRGIHPSRGWGGVTLGNIITKSPKISAARLVVNANPPKLVVEIKGNKGDFLYEEMTMTELWAAYNLIRPNNDLKKMGIQKEDVGLVGIKENRVRIDGSWDFFVHPAIANTVIARQAMRLDMLVALRDPRMSSLPPSFYTYVWCDESATIAASNQRIHVTASTGPPDYLLRLDLWGKEKRISFDTKKIAEELYHRSDALRSIDRFARLLAVLRWLDDSKKLPQLPDAVKPNRVNVPNRWYLSDVLREDDMAIPKDGLKISSEFTRNRLHMAIYVSLTKGKRYDINLIAKNQDKLDSYLVLSDSSGKKLLAKDDDGGLGLDAHILYEPEISGVYQIVATSYPGNRRHGRFTLEVREGKK